MTASSLPKGGGYPLWLERQRQHVHLLTEGDGLPLTFLVTAANVAEVTVGLTGTPKTTLPS
jgi:hypothetical protein